MTLVREPGIGTVEAARRAGISYRTISYWIRQGYVPTSIRAPQGTGEGRSILLSEADVQHLVRLADMVRDGYLVGKASAKLDRERRAAQGPPTPATVACDRPSYDELRREHYGDVAKERFA